MPAFEPPVRFFLGANTPTGFVGFQQELYDATDGWRAYLIKSGPGTGKSTLMRVLYEKLTACGEEAEVLCCSSDPTSLDGVVFPRKKLCVLDATAPHIVEPQYWGAVEQIVPLSVCADERLLHSKAAEIRTVTLENAALHRRCRRYIAAAASLLADNAHIEEQVMDREKIRQVAARIARREWEPSTAPGRETHRFLSAVTPEGILTFYDTLSSLCPRIYTVLDEYGAAARLLLEELRRQALADGQSVISCPCPLQPEAGAEHLIFPELGLGFTTSNSFHEADFPAYRRIHAARFTDAEALRLKRQRLSFNRRAAKELLDTAVTLSAQAKAVHDRMEEYQIAAMDWGKAKKLTDTLAEVFLAE